MHYFCPPWYYNSYMPSPKYSCSKYITYREPVINASSPMHNDRFDQKNRSMQKSKCKMMKQVYRVKKDGRLKNFRFDTRHRKTAY
jgi:hypothetical protein